MKTKRAINNLHFKKRIKQRYGMEINKYDMRAMIKMIQNGEAYLIEKSSLSRGEWRLTYKGQDMIVVYDKNHHTLVTALY